VPCDAIAVRTATLNIVASREVLNAPAALQEIVRQQIEALVEIRPVTIQTTGPQRLEIRVGGYDGVTVTITANDVQVSGRYLNYAQADKLTVAVKEVIEKAGPRIAQERVISKMKASAKAVVDEVRTPTGAALLTLRI
jgi:hypothetical protein